MAAVQERKASDGKKALSPSGVSYLIYIIETARHLELEHTFQFFFRCRCMQNKKNLSWWQFGIRGGLVPLTLYFFNLVPLLVVIFIRQENVWSQLRLILAGFLAPAPGNRNSVLIVFPRPLLDPV